MIEISHQEYQRVADTLAPHLHSTDFYAGRTECTHNGYTSELIATLIVYRQPLHNTDLPTERHVIDVVPVWWEFHTYCPDGNEVLNDFSFSQLKPLLTDPVL